MCKRLTHSIRDREAPADIWGDAELILKVTPLSRGGDICCLSDDAPDGPVRLAFYCKTGFGE